MKIFMAWHFQMITSEGAWNKYISVCNRIDNNNRGKIDKIQACVALQQKCCITNRINFLATPHQIAWKHKRPTQLAADGKLIFIKKYSMFVCTSRYIVCRTKGTTKSLGHSVSDQFIYFKFSATI